MERHQSLLF